MDQREQFAKGEWPQPVERRRWFGHGSNTAPGIHQLYFISSGVVGPIKIGITSDRDLGRRLYQLQTGSADILSVVGSIERIWPATERAVHTFLRPHCIRGEWFERDAALALFQRLQHGRQEHYDNPWLHDLHNLVITSPRSPDESSYDTLEGKVLHKLLWAFVDTTQHVNTALPLPFAAWLATQLHRTDALADLVYEAMHTPSFPRVGTFTQYMEYVTEQIREHEAVNVLLEAWMACDQAVIELLDPPDMHEIDLP